MRILIADDDPVIRKQLEISLAKHGFDTIECADGLEAWEHLQAADAPNLIILDRSMPGLQGLELCAKVRKLDREPKPYIIILTAQNDVKDVIAGLDSGADDYITKPFYPHELVARLKVGIRALELQKELLETRNQLKKEASHDYLTGILNRRAAMDSFQQELKRNQRLKNPLSVALLDLDYFKKVNDDYGHLAGDEVLCETAKRVASALRPYDIFGRYGGEEFLLILPECNGDDAQLICQRVRALICDKSMRTSSGDISISLSVGLCVSSGQGQYSVEEMVQQADHALYQAKETGRNCVRSVKVD